MRIKTAAKEKWINAAAVQGDPGDASNKASMAFVHSVALVFCAGLTGVSVARRSQAKQDPLLTELRLAALVMCGVVMVFSETAALRFRIPRIAAAHC